MRLKNKIVISLMLLGSGFFLYQGFSLLFYPEEKKNVQTQTDLNKSALPEHP